MWYSVPYKRRKPHIKNTSIQLSMNQYQKLNNFSDFNGTFPGGKGGRCVRLTTSPPSCAERHGIWEPKPPGTLWATLGLLQNSFTFTFTFTFYIIMCCDLTSNEDCVMTAFTQGTQVT
jgi:hypothetical protein